MGIACVEGLLGGWVLETVIVMGNEGEIESRDRWVGVDFISEMRCVCAISPTDAKYPGILDVCDIVIAVLLTGLTP